MTPGPDTALTIRNALAGGVRAAFLTAVGVGLGTLFWAAAAVVGVALILSTSPLALWAFRTAGAGYIAYLGVRSLMNARALRTSTEPVVLRALPAGAAFRQGLISNLLNAKTGIFFLTVLPQFVRGGDPR